MIKLQVLLLFAGFSSGVYSLSSWDNEYLTVLGGYNASKIQHEAALDSDTHKFTVAFKKQFLGEGYGVRLLASFSPTYYSTEDYESILDIFNLSSETILFVSSTNEVTSSVSKYQQLLSSTSNVQNSYLGQNTGLYNNNETAAFKWDVGKDRSFFLFSGSGSINKASQSFIRGNELFRETKSKNANTNAMWRQSSDTLWGGSLSFSEVTSSLFGRNNISSITNAYFSARTNYLGSSQLQVNLGVTNSSSREEFSWDVTNTTYVSDFLYFKLNSNRKYRQATNLKSLDELADNIIFSANYSALDYLKISLNVNSEYRSNGSEVLHSINSLGLSLDIVSFSEWLLSIDTQVAQLNDYVGNHKYKNRQINFTVSKALI